MVGLEIGTFFLEDTNPKPCHSDEFHFLSLLRDLRMSRGLAFGHLDFCWRVPNDGRKKSGPNFHSAIVPCRKGPRIIVTCLCIVLVRS